jgi:hypothetical protein
MWHAIWQMCINVSEEPASPIFMAGFYTEYMESTCFSETSVLFYRASCPRRAQSSYSSPWDPQYSHVLHCLSLYFIFIYILSVIYFSKFLFFSFVSLRLSLSVICFRLSVVYFFLHAAYVFCYQWHSFDSRCAVRGRMSRAERSSPLLFSTGVRWCYVYTDRARCHHWHRIIIQRRQNKHPIGYGFTEEGLSKINSARGNPFRKNDMQANLVYSDLRPPAAGLQFLTRHCFMRIINCIHCFRRFPLWISVSSVELMRKLICRRTTEMYDLYRHHIQLL